MGYFFNDSHKIHFHSVTEEENVSAKVAQYSIQNGNNVADHAFRDAKTLEFDGYLFGNDLSDCDRQYQQFLNWQRSGSLLHYYGATYNNNLLITNLEKNYTDGGFRNAIKVKINVTRVDITKTFFYKTPYKPVSPPPKDNAVYVTVKWGNTYWGWWKQYGTPINTLRAWNKYPDRRIPCGVRVRVK